VRRRGIASDELGHSGARRDYSERALNRDHLSAFFRWASVIVVLV
jgi:hypothetical protein